MKNIEDKIPDIINVPTNIILNAKINEVKNEIPSIISLATNASLNSKISDASITNLATTAALTTVENKITNISDLVTL